MRASYVGHANCMAPLIGIVGGLGVKRILDRAADICKIVAVGVVLGVVVFMLLIPFAVYASWHGASEAWDSDIVPAWRRRWRT